MNDSKNASVVVVYGVNRSFEEEKSEKNRREKTQRSVTTDALEKRKDTGESTMGTRIQK